MADVEEVDCDLTKEQVAELKQAFDMFDRWLFATNRSSRCANQSLSISFQAKHSHIIIRKYSTSSFVGAELKVLCLVISICPHWHCYDVTAPLTTWPQPWSCCRNQDSFQSRSRHHQVPCPLRSCTWCRDWWGRHTTPDKPIRSKYEVTWSVSANERPWCPECCWWPTAESGPQTIMCHYLEFLRSDQNQLSL